MSVLHKQSQRRLLQYIIKLNKTQIKHTIVIFFHRNACYSTIKAGDNYSRLTVISAIKYHLFSHRSLLSSKNTCSVKSSWIQNHYFLQFEWYLLETVFPRSKLASFIIEQHAYEPVLCPLNATDWNLKKIFRKAIFIPEGLCVLHHHMFVKTVSHQ